MSYDKIRQAKLFFKTKAIEGVTPGGYLDQVLVLIDYIEELETRQTEHLEAGQKILDKIINLEETLHIACDRAGIDFIHDGNGNVILVIPGGDK
jgi:hypothetical protein